MDFPVYELVFDSVGQLWGTSGGLGLVQIDPATGRVLASYGAGIALGIAAVPGQPQLMVATTTGIKRFDILTQRFTTFSEVRVDSLAISTDGTVYGSEWPEGGSILRFDHRGRAVRVTELNDRIESIAIGRAGTLYQGLLLVGTENSGRLLALDLKSFQVATIASGGNPRIETIEMVVDGRVLVTQGDQIDIFNPIVAPRVIATTPLAGDGIVPVFNQATVTFDVGVKALGSSDGVSANNPDNYRVRNRENGQFIAISQVQYDPSSRTASLLFESLPPAAYELQISPLIQSEQGLPLGGTGVSVPFNVMDDVSATASVHFGRPAINRRSGHIALTLDVTNNSPQSIAGPIRVNLDQWALPGESLSILGPNSDAIIGVGPTGIPYVEIYGTGKTLASGKSVDPIVLVIRNPNLADVNFSSRVLASLPANALPVFSSTPITTVLAGREYRYAPLASDPDGTQLRYVMTKGPSDASIDFETGQITWNPQVNDASSVPFEIRVLDSRGAYQTQSWTVQVGGINQPPRMVGIEDVVTVEESIVEIPLSAFDPDGSNVFYWVDRLPPGAYFDSVRNVIRYRPDNQSSGRYSNVTAYASDGVSISETQFDIIVRNRNAAPNVLAIADRTVLEGDTIGFQISASDVDGDALRYSSANLPPGAILNSSTGQFQWTPGFDQHGLYSVQFTVDDGLQAVNAAFDLVVTNVNGQVDFPRLPEMQLFEGQSLAVRIAAYDPEFPEHGNDPTLVNGSIITDQSSRLPNLTYSHSALPDGATYDRSTGVLSWTPSFTQAGTYSVTFGVEDDGDGTGQKTQDSITLNVRVLDANSRPVVHPIANVNVAVGHSFTSTIQASDVDSDAIRLSASLDQSIAGAVRSLPSFVSFVDLGDGTGRFEFTPVPGDRGNYPIVVYAASASDPGFESSTTFILSVSSVNEPPVLQPLFSRVALIDSELIIPVVATDADDDPLAFQIEGLPNGAIVENVSANQRRIRWTPNRDQIGAHTLLIKVRDDGNGGAAAVTEVSRPLVIHVRDNNTRPSLQSIGSQALLEGQRLVVQPIATDGDADPLHFTLTGLNSVGGVTALPNGLQFDSLTGRIEWIPTYEQAGSYLLRLGVSDGLAGRNEDLLVTVFQGNRAPTFGTVPRLLINEGETLSIALPGLDADNDPLRYSFAGAFPDGMVLDPVTGLITWSPTYSDSGNQNISLTATDSGGLSATASLNIDVINVNRLPEFRLDSQRKLVVGEDFSFHLAAVDPDSDALTIIAEGLPAGATFDATTQLVSWTPEAFQVGSHIVRFRVSDGLATVVRTTEWHVDSQATAPVARLVLTPGFAVIPNTPVVIQPIVQSANPIAAISLVVDGKTRQLDSLGRTTFASQTPGKFPVRLTVTDDRGRQTVVDDWVRVRNLTDTSAPEVSVSLAEDQRIQTLIDVSVAVADDSLDDFRVELIPQGADVGTLLLSGSVAGAHSFQIDPARFANGFYKLQIRATDLGGLETSKTFRFEIDSTQKVGQTSIIHTDAELSIGGIGIPLNRLLQSDGFNAAPQPQSNDGQVTLGAVWQWPLIQPQVAFRATSEVAGRIQQTPLRSGDRLYITLPSGQRVGFTFLPEQINQSGVVLHTPRWVADAGTTWTLTTSQATLVKSSQNGGFYVVGNGLPYTPAYAPEALVNPISLKSPEGLKYEYRVAGASISGPVFVLDNIQNGNGKQVFWSNSGFIAADGDRASIVRDHTGKLIELRQPNGTWLVYRYDAMNRISEIMDLQNDQRDLLGYADEALVVSTRSAKVYSKVDGSSHSLASWLGGTRNFLGREHVSTLDSSGRSDVAFTITESELKSSDTGVIHLAIGVTSGDFIPSVPQVIGLTAIETRELPDGKFVVFKISEAGTYVLTQRSSSFQAGSFTTKIVLAGDANTDMRIDSTDAQIAQNPVDFRADFNRDGRIDGNDRAMVAQSLGFVANRPPESVAVSVTLVPGQLLRIPIDQLMIDPDGDALTIKIESLHPQIQAQYDPATRSISVSSSLNFTGKAAVRVTATDGVTEWKSTELEVNRKNVEVTRIRTTPERGLLNLGESQRLVVNADYSDATTIELDPYQMAWQTSDPDVLQISGGYAIGVGDGASSIIARLDGHVTASAWMVGEPTEIDLLATAVMPLDVYPAAVMLPVQESRNLKVSLDGLVVDSSIVSPLFISSDESVVTVDANGRLTTKAAGNAEILVMLGAGLSRVAVSVLPPSASGTVVSTSGATIAGAGGWVAVPPGALADPVPVSIASVDTTQLPAVSSQFETVGGFSLGSQGAAFNAPVQVAVPVTGASAGDTVYFQRASKFKLADGSEMPIWIQDEFGTVGTDGIARTSSPPSTGVRREGDFTIVKPKDMLVPVRMSLEILRGDFINHEGLVFTGTQSFGGAAMALDLLAGGLGSGVLTPALNFTLFLPRALTKFELWVINDGVGTLVATHETDTSVEDSLSFVLDGDPESSIVDGGTPLIESIEFQRVSGDATGALQEVVIDGRNLFVPSPDGFPNVQEQDIQVRIVVGAADILDDAGNVTNGLKDIVITGNDLSLVDNGPRQSLKFKLPSTVPAGLTQMIVARPVQVRTGTNRFNLEHRVSRPFSVTTDPRYSFAAATQAGSVVVVGRDTAGTLAKTAEIRLQPAGARPLATMMTGDLSRVYVTLAELNAIAVLDAVTLSQLDADGDASVNSDGIGDGLLDIIRLPQGASVDRMVLDKQDAYLYVADPHHAAVYVVDVRPSSSTFNQVVRAIPVGPAPYGLRSMAITADGGTLMAAAPGYPMFREYKGSGHVLLIDLVPDNFPVGVTETGETIYEHRPNWSQTGQIEVGPEPFGLTATDDPDVVLMSDRRNEGAGYIVLRRQDDGKWIPRSIKTQLGANVPIGEYAQFDPLDVDNTSAIELIPGRVDYGFITGFSSYDFSRGGNIGVIYNPLGLKTIDGKPTEYDGKPALIAATQQIEIGLPDNLTVAADGRTLLVAFQGKKEIVAYDIPSIIKN